VRRRKTLIPVIALVAALALAPAAMARGGAGHNPATKKLEDAFKIALYVRSVSKDGCYPPAPRLARAIGRAKRGLHVGVANSPGSVHRFDTVFIIKHGSTCNHVLMALRASSGLYILNSAQGTIRVQGRGGPRITPGKPGPPRGVRLISKTFKMSAPDQLTRFEVICPGGTAPIGGGMSVNVPPGPDGEGVYPHSFERLGAQRGFHVSEVLYDAEHASTTPRNVTVQAVCARGQIPQNPTPHKTVFIKPGEVKSATARCPHGQYLITGGFQRTNFASDGGNYIIESHADGPSAWKVTGSAFIGTGTTGGGELTAIAYCSKAKGPILTEVPSMPVPVQAGQSASATSPSCPAGLTLTTTGFGLGDSTSLGPAGGGEPRNAFYAGNSINDDNTTTANAFGYFGAAPGLTAYAYCQRAR
jgi:hypothetical protein